MKKTIWIGVLVVAVAVLAVVVVRLGRQPVPLQNQQALAGNGKVKPVAVPVPKKRAPELISEETMAEPQAVAVAAEGSSSNFFDGIAGMMKDPQMKEMMRLQQKMMVDKMYGALFKQLGWSAADLDKLKELLLNRQMSLMEAGMAMMSGSADARKQAAEQAKTIKAEQDKKIQEFLGPQAYDVFQEYENTVGERLQIQMFREGLPADAALTDQQEADLIAAMYEARKTLPSSSLLNNREPDPSQLTEERIAETLKQLEQLQQRYAERAAAILSPAQLEQFTKWQQQMSAMQSVGLKMAAKMFGDKPAQSPLP